MTSVDRTGAMRRAWGWVAGVVLAGLLAGASAWSQERGPVVSPVREAASDEVVRRALRETGSAAQRVSLIEAIEKHKRAAFLADLVSILGDENKDVREAAARAIASFGWDKMSPPMLELMRRRTLPYYVRELALRTLVASDRREAVEPLMALLEEPVMRPAATSGLKALTFQNFTEADDWYRWWADNKDKSRAEWIGSRTDELAKAIRRLEAELTEARTRIAEVEKRNTELTNLAADAIIRSLEQRPDKKDPARVIAALDEPFDKVRIYAAGELAKLRAEDALRKLSEMAVTDASVPVRVAATAALGQIGSTRAVPTLVALLSDVDEDVAAEAARSLGRLKAEAVVNRILLALLNRSAKVREAAAEALGQMRTPAAVAPLIELLANDGEDRVRERAARALGEIGDVRAFDALTTALGDKSPGVRVYAIEALGALGDERIVTRLCDVLKDDTNAAVREAAAVALGKAGNASCIDVLVTVLANPKEKLAQYAASSILAICKRDERLFEPTAAKLSTAGYHEQTLALYEELAKSLAGKKDEKHLLVVRSKMADSMLALKQWSKAAALLEELTKVQPDDVPLARKLAWALTELGRHSEAYSIYDRFAAGKTDGAYWPERLSLLDAMLAEKKASEVARLLAAGLKEPEKVPADVRTKLEEFKRRATAIIDEQKQTRAEEIRTLIRTSAEAGKPGEDARKQLKAMGDEALPHLVSALDFADEAVRRAAATMLREISRQNFGFKPEASLDENAEAIRKWKEWLNSRLKPAG